MHPLPHIHSTTISGIPTFWSPKPGPLNAGLIFRVGAGDERLAQSGITHLIEHLAMFQFHDVNFVTNASVGHSFTEFEASGSPAEVAHFFKNICATLNDLPFDRLELERNILEREEGRHEPGSFDVVAARRHGFQGPGISVFPQVGINNVDVEQITRWKTEYFTKLNAIIWMTGEPTAELFTDDLIDLPEGMHQTLQIPHLPLNLPAYFEEDVEGIAFSLLLPAGLLGTFCAHILHTRLEHAYRIERGIAYDIEASPVAVNADFNELFFGVDSADKHASTVIEVLLKVLDDLATNGPQQTELQHYIEQCARADSDPDLLTEILAGISQMKLLNRPYADPRTVAERAFLVKPEELKGIFHTARSTLLLATPRVDSDLTKQLSELTDPPSIAIEGEAFQMPPIVVGGERATLIVGEQGVTYSPTDPKRVTTVLFADCVAYEMWDNGIRVLFSRNGNQISIFPSLYKDGRRALDIIEKRIDASSFVKVASADRLEDIEERPTPQQWIARRKFRCLAAVLLVAFYVVGSMTYVRINDRQNDELLKHGERTFAIVTAQHPSETLQREMIDIRFTTANDRQVSTHANVALAKNHPIQSTVEIAYDPNNPEAVWPAKGGYDGAIDAVINPWIPLMMLAACSVYIIVVFPRYIRTRRAYEHNEPVQYLATGFERKSYGRDYGVVALYEFSDSSPSGKAVDQCRDLLNNTTPVAYCQITSEELQWFSIPMAPVTVRGRLSGKSTSIITDTDDRVLAISWKTLPTQAMTHHISDNDE